jgi:hypothetical protein
LKVEGVNGPIAVEGRVAGDLAVASVNGPLAVAAVQGDANVVECDVVQFESVAGDLSVKDLRGEIHVHRVGGDSKISSCAGPVNLEAVGGDLTARDLRGGITAPAVGGRARLNTIFAPGQTYLVDAGGSATVLIEGDPSTLSATFELRRHDGADVVVAFPLEDPVVEPGYIRGRVGAGEATVRVTSRGSLRIGRSGQESQGFEGFFEGIFDDLGESLRGAFSGFGWSGPGGWAEEHAERFASRAEQRAQEAAQRVAEDAERRARRVSERAQRQAERAARHFGHSFGGWRWSGQPFQPGPFWPSSPTPPSRPAPSPRPRATEEERLAILNMLAAGTINAEEAARLLEALGS